MFDKDEWVIKLNDYCINVFIIYVFFINMV